MENLVCRVCQEEASSLCTCSSYLCKNHTEYHKCSDSLEKIIISLYKNVDDKSRSTLTLYLEQIKAMITSLLSLSMTGAKYYNELYKQSKQIDDQLLFVRNSRYIKNDLFLSPIEFFLTRAQSETNKFIEEVPIPNINQSQIIDFQQIKKIINNIYNFNYFKISDAMSFEINWISERHDDLFTLFYQKGIEFLWSKSYENAKKSFLLCKWISEKVISYDKVCNEILDFALSTTEQLLLEKDVNEIVLSIKHSVKALLDDFPLSSNLIVYEISRIYVAIENYKKAIKCSLECLKNIQEDKEKFYLWTYLGFLYQCILDFDNAKIYYDKCEDSINSNLINLLYDLQNWYLNIAEFHNIKGEYEKAIEKYILGVSICKQNPASYQMLINFHFKLGEAFNFMNDFEKSKKHYLQAKKLSKKCNNINLITIYLKLSELYLKNFELDKAQKTAKLCKKLCENYAFNETINFVAIYRILGIIMFHQGNIEKCELFFLRSFNLCEKNRDFNWIYLIIGLDVFEFYILSNNLILSQKHFQRLNEKIEKLKSKNYNSFLFYDILSKFYVLSYDIDKLNIIIAFWQHNRNKSLEYDTNEKCEIYYLNALKCAQLKDYKESENWLMKWKISLNPKKLLNKSQYFKFNLFLGCLYVLSKNIPKAKEIFLEASKDFENTLEYDNPKLGFLYMHLGMIYTQSQELLNSLNYFEKALYIFGIKSQCKEIVFKLYNNLGAIRMIINGGEDSENYFLRAKDLYNKTKLVNLMWIFEFHQNQAIYWIFKDNWTESRKWINESKKFAYDKLLHFAQSDYLEAVTWMNELNYQKAERILIKGLNRLKRLKNHDSEQLLFEKFYKAIVICYKNMNKIKKYEKYMKKYHQLLIKRNAPVCTDDNVQIDFYLSI